MENTILDFYIIYKLIFPNNKIYVGQTINFKKRMDYYKYGSLRDNKLLINVAIKKYGWENIKKEIICTVSEEFVDEAEKYFIKKYKSNNKIFGYNIEDGGNKNKHLSEETKKKIGKAFKGRISPRKGKKLSDETKRKISIANSGKKFSHEHKQKLSKAKLGKKQTKEHIQNVIKAKKERKISEMLYM